MAGILIQRRHAHRENAMWGWRQISSDAATSQEMPRMARKPPESRETAWDRFSLVSQWRNQPCWQLDLGLLASGSDCETVNFSWLSPLVYSSLLHSPRKLIQLGTAHTLFKELPLCIESKLNFEWFQELKFPSSPLLLVSWRPIGVPKYLSSQSS